MKQRLKLHFDFGWHIGKGDAKDIRKRLVDFRPHFYVIEDYSGGLSKNILRNALTDEEFIRVLNKNIERARKRNIDALQFLERISRGNLSRDEKMTGFMSEQYAAIIDFYRLRVFILEDHGEYEKLSHLMKSGENADLDASGALFRMDTNAAISYLRRALSLYAQAHPIREKNIVQNLESLMDKLIKNFPEVSHLDEIRVFVRYGQAHRKIYNEAVKLGLNSTINYDPEQDTIESDLIIALIDNPGITFDDEKLLNAIIEITLSSVFYKVFQLQGIHADYLPLGIAVKRAKEYMRGKTVELLLKLFEESSSLPQKEAELFVISKLMHKES